MNDFQDVETVHGLLGDYWYSIYNGEEQIHNYVEAFLEAQKQADQSFSELVKSLSRKTIEPFRKLLHVPYWVLQSEYDGWSHVPYKHDGAITYSSGAIYDSIMIRTDRIKIPSTIKTIDSISNRLDNAEIAWSPVTIEDNWVSIDASPFDGSFQIESVFNAKGEKIDQKALLWLNMVQVDYEDLYNLYGYQFDIKLPSSDFYKQLLNILYDSVVSGPSRNNTIALIQAVTGLDEVNMITNPESIDIPGLILDSTVIKRLDNPNVLVLNKDYPVILSTEREHTRLDLPVLGRSAEEFNDSLFNTGVSANLVESEKCITDELKKYNINTGTAVEPVVTTGAGFRDITQVLLGR